VSSGTTLFASFSGKRRIPPPPIVQLHVVLVNHSPQIFTTNTPHPTKPKFPRWNPVEVSSTRIRPIGFFGACFHGSTEVPNPSFPPLLLHDNGELGWYFFFFQKKKQKALALRGFKLVGSIF
jgi:hypothetical protein